MHAYIVAGSHNLAGALPTFEAMGVQLTVIEYRSSFAFVAVKGSKYQAIVDEKAQYKGPSLLHTVI